MRQRTPWSRSARPGVRAVLALLASSSRASPVSTAPPAPCRSRRRWRRRPRCRTGRRREPARPARLPRLLGHGCSLLGSGGRPPYAACCPAAPPSASGIGDNARSGPFGLLCSARLIHFTKAAQHARSDQAGRGAVAGAMTTRSTSRALEPARRRSATPSVGSPTAGRWAGAARPVGRTVRGLRAGEFAMRVDADPRPAARISGSVVQADGTPP